MNNKKVGFIGAGYMGYGMAKNLNKDFDVYIIAHKNREPIDKLIKEGATEVFSYKELLNLNLNCLLMCVTNTPIAINIAEEIVSLIRNELLIIDLTTHNKNGTTKMKNILNSTNIKYTVNPVMGGPVQSKEGVLGGIWGGEIKDFDTQIIQQLLSKMSGGMAVALYTTLTGLITSVLLKLQYFLLDSSLTSLINYLSSRILDEK